MVASYILSSKKPEAEKLTPYECGFNPIYTTGKPFSIAFFVVAILFLIFELEVMFLIPFFYSMYTVSAYGTCVVALFIVALVAGLAYEWVNKGLEWK